MQAGRGLNVFNVHGDLADAVINLVPSHLTNDVVVFDAASDHVVPFKTRGLNIRCTFRIIMRQLDERSAQMNQRRIAADRRLSLAKICPLPFVRDLNEGSLCC